MNLLPTFIFEFNEMGNKEFSWSGLKLYIRDHKGWIFSDQKCHPETSLIVLTAWQYWLSITKPKKCLQSNQNGHLVY